MKKVFAICLTAFSLHGQPGKIAAPTTGYVFDASAHGLRRIQGIPGAAVVGEPVDFGFALSAAYVAPRLDSAFVLTGDGPARLFRLSADAPVEIALDSLGTPQRVVFSPSGSAAALYSTGSVQVVKGLPNAPKVAGTITWRVIAARVRHRPVPDMLAISDDGAYLLHSDGGPVELIDVALGNRQGTSAHAGSIAAFAPGGHDAAAISAGQLILFQDIAGAATERTFAGVAAPSALAFSRDAQKLFVASATGRAVTTIQTSTGDRVALTCDCAPSTLTPMGGLLRLNELGAEPLWVLDAVSDRGLLFVPALAPREAAVQ